MRDALTLAARQLVGAVVGDRAGKLSVPSVSARVKCSELLVAERERALLDQRAQRQRDDAVEHEAAVDDEVGGEVQ